MKAYGTAATVILAICGAYALLMFGVSFAGIVGQTPMLISAITGVIGWGVFLALTHVALRHALAVRRGERAQLDASLSWTSNVLLGVSIASLVTAVALAPLAFASCGPTFLAGLYHWGGLLGGSAAFVTWFAFPYIARGAGAEGVASHRVRTLVITGAVVYGLVGVFWLGAWLMLRGSIDAKAYPSSASSPYQLPYPDGDRSWIIQGNNSSFNHEGHEQHAWDFRRRCGTPVLAARGGTVTRVVDLNDGNGKGKPNNLVEVAHGDGTVARYLHISKGSAKVAKGDTVSQGQPLAEVGNVGNSLTGHIHFVVEQGGNSIPVTFRDVDEDKGIPRTFERYASK